MANRVTFDYSKTAGYISEGEITSMKRITEDAKKLLLSVRVKVMISLDGSTSRLIMTRKNLNVSRKQLQRSRVIQMF